jgi:hypothetical protein
MTVVAGLVNLSPPILAEDKFVQHLDVDLEFIKIDLK